MDYLACSCCGQTIPNDTYGTRCEDCWAVGAGHSARSGHVPFFEKVLYGFYEGTMQTGYWKDRGRVIRK